MKAEKKANLPCPNKIFEFELEKKLQCTSCHKVKYRKSTEKSLTVTAPVNVNNDTKELKVPLSDCLNAYFAPSLIEDVNCEVCGKKCNMT